MNFMVKKFFFDKNNHFRDKTLLFVICITHIVIHFYIANFLKVITTYPDELRYYEIARSLFQGNGISYRGVPFDFQKIAYSIVLAPLFLIKNGFLRNSSIALINAILMTTSIIPLLSISKKLHVGLFYRYIVLFIALFRPDMTAFPMTFSSENLYWILFFTFVDAWLSSIDSPRYWNSVLCGILCYFLYLCKEISLALLLAYIAFEFFEQVFIQKKLLKTRIAKVFIFGASFLAVFILFKITIFRGMGNSYSQMGLTAIRTPYNFTYMIRGFFVLLSAFMLCSFFFPIIYPILHYKKMNTTAKHLFIFAISFLAIAASVIAYTITVREDLGRVSPRLHFRYVSPAFPILFAVFFSLLTEVRFKSKQILKQEVLTIICILLPFAFIFKGGMIGSPYDPMSLYWYLDFAGKIGTLNHDGGIPFYTFALVLNSLICLFAILLHFVFIKKSRLFVFLFSAVIFFTSLFDSVSAARIIKRDYSVSEDFASSTQETINKLEKENSNILLISASSEMMSKFFETYFDDKSKVYFCRESDFSDLKEQTPITQIHFFEGIWHKPYQKISEIDYVVIPREKTLEPSDSEIQKDLSTRYFYVYKLNNPNLLSFREKKEREFLFANNLFLNGGYDKNGTRFLPYGAFSFGPYWKLPEGRYKLSLSGKNLSNVFFDLYSDYSATHYEIINSDLGDDKCILFFTLEKATENWECFIRNDSETEVEISSFLLERVDKIQ